MNKVTKQQKEEIERLEAISDRDIDTRDMPEITDWSEAVVGKYYRPVTRLTD